MLICPSGSRSCAGVLLLRAVLAAPGPAPSPSRILAAPAHRATLRLVAAEAAPFAVPTLALGGPQLVTLQRAGRERQRPHESAHRFSPPPGRPRAAASARHPANPPTSRGRPGAPRCELMG